MHAGGPFFLCLQHNSSPCDPGPPQTREHTRNPPRPPHGLSGGRRRLTDDGHGASRGTLRTDADDRSGWLALPSEEHSQPVAVAVFMG